VTIFMLLRNKIRMLRGVILSRGKRMNGLQRKLSGEFCLSELFREGFL
jgi:hypothetical protein